jgi:hypothetical protein
MTDTKPRAEKHVETRAEAEERVRLAEEDRAERAKTAPLTGVRSVYDVVRHLAVHGPGRSDAERAELAGAVNASDPDYTAPAEEDEADR